MPSFDFFGGGGVLLGFPSYLPSSSVPLLSSNVMFLVCCGLPEWVMNSVDLRIK